MGRKHDNDNDETCCVCRRSINSSSGEGEDEEEEEEEEEGEEVVGSITVVIVVTSATTVIIMIVIMATTTISIVSVTGIIEVYQVVVTVRIEGGILHVIPALRIDTGIGSVVLRPHMSRLVSCPRCARGERRGTRFDTG